MSKAIGYIKYGSHAGYKVYDHVYYIEIWQIGSDTIYIPKAIAKQVLDDIGKLL
jgi:hypothetical protein